MRTNLDNTRQILDKHAAEFLHRLTERAWSLQRKPQWPLWSQNAPPKLTTAQEQY